MPARRGPSVTDRLFRDHPTFFRARDRLQVKYEMLRAHAVDARPVRAVCQAFGFSRQSFYTERALPHGRAGRVAPAAARAAGTDKMHHGGRDFLARREDPRSYALRRHAGGARRRAFRDPAPSADGRACTWPAPTSIKKRLTARPPGHCRPFLETGDLAQACYERLRAAFLAGAWEGSPDSAQFTRGGFVSLLSLERPVWSVEICQAAPPRWQGARAPQQAALCDVVHWLLAPRPVSALARKEVS